MRLLRVKTCVAHLPCKLTSRKSYALSGCSMRTRRLAPFNSGWELTKAELKVPVQSTGGNLTRLERQGLDRLVRTLRGISIGIALAGGGAKGMAHFGVLQALEAAGLSFDVMSGTSAGAMAGILYAAGMTPRNAIENFRHDLTPRDCFATCPSGPTGIWCLNTVDAHGRHAPEIPT